MQEGTYINSAVKVHGNNAFAEVSKNLTRYKSENKFGASAKMSKFFAALLIMLECST